MYWETREQDCECVVEGKPTSRDKECCYYYLRLLCARARSTVHRTTSLMRQNYGLLTSTLYPLCHWIKTYRTKGVFSMGEISWREWRHDIYKSQIHSTFTFTFVPTDYWIINWRCYVTVNGLSSVRPLDQYEDSLINKACCVCYGQITNSRLDFRQAWYFSIRININFK